MLAQLAETLLKGNLARGEEWSQLRTGAIKIFSTFQIASFFRSFSPQFLPTPNNSCENGIFHLKTREMKVELKISKFKNLYFS